MDGKNIGPYFFKKIKMVRKLLGRTQRQVSYDLDRSQRDISAIEKGVRDKMVPHDLLNYYYENGVDLNWLYLEEDAEAITYEAAEKKAFRVINGLRYYRVPQDDVDKLIRLTDEADYPKHFKLCEVALTARVTDTYVGFLIVNDLPPYQAGDEIICRKSGLTDLKRDNEYLLITGGQLVSVKSGDRKPASSDKYVHWVDGKMLMRDVQQMWEPVKRLAGAGDSELTQPKHL
ncbi:helix-turn-helix domain-containing protein [Roseivirga sp. BDSF3-8]|uniref:helix-turn-helix domain-containing protein n=1 Tax=Roseivirga sp. BDSF3-8 TaxID=3241598 RepID=UPI00353225EE